MNEIAISTKVEQLHEMGMLSEKAIKVCMLLDAQDAFTLTNYALEVKTLFEAAGGDIDVVEEIVKVGWELKSKLFPMDENKKED